MAKDHVIFDLDGTLVDPSVSIFRSINYAMEKKGFAPINNEKLFPYIGRRLAEPFKAFTGNGDEDYLKEMIGLYRERYETIGLKENKLYPGIKKMLASLRAKNYIASIKPGHSSRLILKELGVEDYFADVYGSELDGTRSNKTELLHYIKEKEKIGSAVMVGDRDTDMIAAKSCGFASIAVCYGYGSCDELKACEPDIMVERPEELKMALEII